MGFSCSGLSELRRHRSLLRGCAMADRRIVHAEYYALVGMPMDIVDRGGPGRWPWHDRDRADHDGDGACIPTASSIRLAASSMCGGSAQLFDGTSNWMTARNTSRRHRLFFREKPMGSQEDMAAGGGRFELLVFPLPAPLNYWDSPPYPAQVVCRKSQWRQTGACLLRELNLNHRSVPYEGQGDSWR